MAQSSEIKLLKRFDQNVEITGTLTVGGNSVLTSASTLNASQLGNYGLNGYQNYFGGIPYIQSDGVMEIGRYIDFHEADNATSDYDYRLSSNNGILYGNGNFTIGSNNFTAGTATIGGILLQDSADRSGVLEVNRKGTSSWSGIQINHADRHWSFIGDDNEVGVFDDHNGEWIWHYAINNDLSLYYNGVEQARTQNGYFLATNEFRSEVFRGLNTVYHVTPAGTSNLNALTLGGTLTLGSLTNDFTSTTALVNSGSGVVGQRSLGSLAFLSSVPSHSHDYIEKVSTVNSNYNFNDLYANDQLRFHSTYATNGNWSTASVTNYPSTPTVSSAYGYGSTLSLRNNGQGMFQIYAPHNQGGNSDMFFRTGWNTDFRAWARMWTDRNHGSGSGLDADKLDGLQSSQFLRSDASDTMSGTLTVTGQVIAQGTGFKSTNELGMVGDYDTNGTADKIIWTIGDSWNSLSSHYGIGYDYDGTYGHHLVFRNNGSSYSRIPFSGQSALFSGGVKSPTFYDSNDTSAYADLSTGSIRLGNSSGRSAITHYDGSSGFLTFRGTTSSSTEGWGWSFTNNDVGATSYNTYFRIHYDSTPSSSYTLSTGSSRAPIFYDSDNTNYYLNPTNSSYLSGTVNIKGSSADWDTSTPGLTKGTIHLDPENSTDHYGNAITFGASDAGGGDNSHAGIYVRSDGSYGTKMYLATTNSYAQGSKVAIEIDHNGHIFAQRNSVRAGIFYDINDTNYYGDFASTSRMNVLNTNVYRSATSSNNGRFESGSSWGTRHMTDSGYIQFGPANSSHAHIYTDKTNFLLNKELMVDSGAIGSYDEDLDLRRAGSSKITAGVNNIYVKEGIRIQESWGQGDYGAEALTIIGSYPSIALRNNAEGHKWLIHHDGGSDIQFYEGATWDNNTWSRRVGFRNGTTGIEAYQFRDIENTSYFVKPASTSTIRKTNIVASGSGWYDGLNLISSDGSNTWNLLVDNGASDMFRVAFNGSEKFRIQTDGEVFTVGTGKAGSDYRAPIFYDSNNTAYYLDLNNTSQFGAINMNGTLNMQGHSITNAADSSFNGDISLISGGIGSNADGASTANQVTRILIPQGGAGSWDGGQTGAIKIRLPIRANNNMWSMKVRIYNYSGGQTSEYLLGNYSYSAGGYNASASFQGGVNSTPLNVRFGNDGTYDCVWIGETGTGWSYPVVSVLDFQAGFRSASIGTNVDNYDVSIVTSFGTVGATVSPDTKAGYDVFAHSSSRAPIFYDSNNTAYYLNPASVSVMDSIYFDGSSSRAIYGASLNGNNAVRINGNWDSFDIMGRVLDWSASNLHFGDGYNGVNHSAYYFRLGSSGNINYFHVGGDGYFEGDVIAYYSDARLKQNVKPIENALDIIKEIRGVTFEWNKLSESVWKKKEGDKDFGLIAQEVEAVFPMGVAIQAGAEEAKKKGYSDPNSEYYDPLHVPINEDEEYKTVRYDKMVSIAIQAIKEQQCVIEELKQEIQELKKLINP